jgi:hypothetical protein
MEIFKNQIGESTKKVYLNNLKKLGGNFSNLNFLKDTEEIEKKIPTNPNTERSYYIAIVSALKGRKGFKKQFDYYYEKMTNSNKTLQANSFKSDSTKKKYDGLTYDMLEKRYQDLLDEFKKTHDYQTLQYLILVGLYILVPPRRLMDYILMKIGTGTDASYNYYDGSRFIFNKYKTAKSSKTQIEKVPDELVKLLNLYIKMKPFPESDFLLHTQRTSKVNSNSQMLALLRKAFDNATIGCSVLRSLFLTSKYGDQMKQLKKDVKSMGTSTNVAESTYIS